MKAVFLDRDGTLVKDYSDERWRTITNLEIYSDTFTALRRIPNDFLLFIVTNQYLIQEGYVSQEQFQNMHKELIKRLASRGIKIEQTYYCPHSRSINCKCRKPGRGMVDQCLLNYDIDLRSSFFIGDSENDVKLAHNIGCTPIAVRNYPASSKPTKYAKDLGEAVDFIEKF